MRRTATLLLIVPISFISTSFLLMSGMSRVRMAELRQQVQRDRILNYELSSRVLQLRIHDLLGVRQEFASEVSAGVFETQILNATAVEMPALNLIEYGSLLGINVVRRMMWKTPLTLEQDTETWQKLSAAFLLERMRRFGSAARLYSQVLDRGLTEDSQAFVMLHLGYCLAAQGEFERALPSLEAVRGRFTGTHYAETASRIIEMILSGDRESTRIEASNVSRLEKARRLASIGRCAVALQYFQGEQKEVSDLYVEAGCLEKTGQIPLAIDQYRAIANKIHDSELQKEINRRLLLVGEFYGGGQQVRDEAVSQAKALGDSSAVTLIQTASQERRKDIIPEAMLLNEGIAPIKPVENASKPEVRTEVRTETRRESAAVPDRIVESPPKTRTENSIVIQTRDGRHIATRSLTFDASSLIMQSTQLKIRLPLGEVMTIATADETTLLHLYLTDGQGVLSSSFQLDWASGQIVGDGQPVPMEKIARISAEKRQ